MYHLFVFGPSVLGGMNDYAVGRDMKEECLHMLKGTFASFEYYQLCDSKFEIVEEGPNPYYEPDEND